MSKKKMRKDRAMEEITRLKAKRRGGIVQACIGGILGVLAIFGVPTLQMYGILPQDNTVISFLMFATVVVVCAILGMGVRTFSNCSQQITALRQQHGISEEEFRAL